MPGPIGGWWSSISILRMPERSSRSICHSAPSQSHLRKSHPPAWRIRSRRGKEGTVARHPSHTISTGRPSPSAARTTRTSAPFSRIFLARRSVVIGSTAITLRLLRAARIANAPPFAPRSRTTSSSLTSSIQYSGTSVIWRQGRWLSRNKTPSRVRWTGVSPDGSPDERDDTMSCEWYSCPLTFSFPGPEEKASPPRIRAPVRL
jgi:hypothetical protein